MDYLSIIRKPIEAEMEEFTRRFDRAMTADSDLLGHALAHIRQRAGKRMRPMLILLMARNYGAANTVTQDAALGLELLHTASLIHDDVVDESAERRGQQSVNALYDNKVAVLVGDYILSTALSAVARTGHIRIVSYLARLGQTLSEGELLQLSSIGSDELSEEAYYSVIRQKTAALFEACCAMGALSAGATEAEIKEAEQFGQRLGMIFQIRDDIFDYFPQSAIGKPTGNDMAEGKLTLPALYAVATHGDDRIRSIARKVRRHTVSTSEIDELVGFTISHGGIGYAEQKMAEFSSENRHFIESATPPGEVREALAAYLDFVSERTW